MSQKILKLTMCAWGEFCEFFLKLFLLIINYIVIKKIDFY